MRRKRKSTVEKLLYFLIGKVLEESQCTLKSKSVKEATLYKKKVIKFMLSKEDDYSKNEGETFDWSPIKGKLKCILPILIPIVKNRDAGFDTVKKKQKILHSVLDHYVKYQFLDIIDIVKKLLKSGASVDYIDKDGLHSPLHIAAHQGNQELMMLMLDNCSDVNICNKYGNTPLHIIVNCPRDNQANMEILRILLSKGADPNVKNKEGMSAVHFAAEHCLVEVLRILKKCGADFDLRTNEGKTVLHLVCGDIWGFKDNSNDINTINYLVSEGSDVNATDNEGYSPLHYAAVSCSLKVVQRLIRLGADVNRRTMETQLTPLHVASRSGNVMAIEFFINAGMDVNVEAIDGITPLHLAILENSYEAVECLIGHGADVHARETMNDYAPMHLMAIGCQEKFKLLVSNGAEVNVANKDGITPLHLASMIGNVEVVQALIERGADVHCRDEFRWTPLHLASLTGQLDVVTILIDRGVDVDVKEKFEHMTPLHLASMRGILDLNFFDGIVHYIDEWKGEMMTSFCSLVSAEVGDIVPLKSRYQHDEVAKLLLRKGADVNAKNIERWRPINFACQQSDDDVVLTLLKSGADVDVRHKRINYSPMEDALRFEDTWRLRYLLEFGANVNEFSVVKEMTKDAVCEGVWEEVYDHLLKLRAVDLPIANAYKTRVDEADMMDHRYTNEIQSLKTYKIGEGELTLHDFLHMKPKHRLKYVEKAMLFKIESNFPEYQGIIRASYREALDYFECKQLFDLALIAFRRVTDVHWPHICAERIFFYLDSWHLEMIIDVADCLSDEEK